MARYKLHCFAESGNAYKAALMLNLSSADWQPVWVDFFNGAQKSDEFRQLNPLGEVPVLETEDGNFSQSGVILDYLADRLDCFKGKNEADKREVLRWLFFDNHKFTSYLATLRFMRHFGKTGETEVVKFFQGRVTGSFSTVENHLQGRDFIVGSYPTIADISMCGYLFFLDEAQIDLASFPAIAAWLERIKLMPGWQHPYDLMPGSEAS